jgi:ABC-type transporter Mla subunit MlaD
VAPNSDHRLGAVVFIMGLIAAAGTTVAAILGWQVVGSPIERLDRLSAGMGESLATLTDNIGLAGETMARVQDGLETTGAVLRDSSSSLSRLEAGMSDTAEILVGDLPDTLSAVAQALPGLIASTSQLEPALSSLSFLGVEYAPDVPLNQSLTQLQESLDPLPEELRASGELIATLSGDTAMLSGQASELAGSLEGIADDLADAGARLTEEAGSVDEARQLLEVERARLPVLERRARVVLTIFGTAVVITELAVALIGWSHWRGQPPGTVL